MRLVNIYRLLGEAPNRYILAGCANTILSYVLFLVLLHALRVYLPEENTLRLAIFSSFWISLVIGFTLQRFFVWRDPSSQIKNSEPRKFSPLRRSTRKQFGVFTAYNTFLVLSNIIAVELMKRSFLIDARLGQIAFTIIYALCGYFFGRWLFNKP